MKSILYLMLVASAFPALTHATEAMDAALYKGSNPLKEAMGKPVYAHRVYQDGYHCWDPALIKVGDTYHLFYSRWLVVPGRINDMANWMTTSEIVHAVSSDILGPYRNIENPMLSAKVPTESTQSNPREGAGIIIWPVDGWKPERQRKPGRVE